MIKDIIENNKEVQPNSAFLEHLKQFLPEYFDKNGNFKIDKFQQSLQKSNIQEAKDGYHLGFVGKDYARLQTGRESETIIVPDIIHNNLPENKNSQNVFITGDNLEALRHLQNAYTNKIKLIYIDPPYNTGGEFIYQDSFEFKDSELQKLLGYTEEEIKRLKTIQGKSSHSAWLTFMYPRLKIAQKLLKDDGVIFISIDDNEQANLKLLMDDIYGEENLIGNFVINKASEIATANTVQKHEYIIVYAKNFSNFKVNGIPKHSISRGTVGNINQTTPIINFPKGLHCYGMEEGVYPSTRKIENSRENIENLDPIIVKNGKLEKDVRLKARWRSSNDMRNFFNNNCRPTEAKINGIIEEIYFENDRFNPQIKKATYEKLSSLILKNKRGSLYLEELDLKNVFDNPKDVENLKSLIEIVGTQDEIILDFFAGSSTTAQAVMELNAKEKSGKNRKFIMVQLDEPVSEGSEAQKLGYKSIDEISRERIKRAAKNISTTNPSFGEQGNLGFKHYNLLSPNIVTIDKIIEFEPDPSKFLAEDMITPFGYRKTGTEGQDTILRTWMLRDGLDFNETAEEIHFSQYPAHYIKKAGIVYLIQPDFTHDSLKSLLNKIGRNEIQVQTVIVYPYSFTFEQMRELKYNIKTNLDSSPVIIERY